MPKNSKVTASQAAKSPFHFLTERYNDTYMHVSTTGRPREYENKKINCWGVFILPGLTELQWQVSIWSVIYQPCWSSQRGRRECKGLIFMNDCVTKTPNVPRVSTGHTDRPINTHSLLENIKTSKWTKVSMTWSKSWPCLFFFYFPENSLGKVL